MRQTLDRERKWLQRNTKAGRFKRQLEYHRARQQRMRVAPDIPLRE
jgi:hypothetical protein